MKKIMLKDLFSIRKGKKVEPVEAPSDDTVRYIQIEDLRDNSNPKFCLPKESYVFANKNHIIIAWDGANAGTVSYGLEGAIGSTLAILETREKNVFIPYVGKFLQSKNQYLRDTCTGATIPHISRKALENIVIPLPSVERQKYISNTLDKAKSLIEKRKAQIEALDQLTQSVFLEMFGDPVKNGKGWYKTQIGDISELITKGESPKWQGFSYVENGIRFITSENVLMGKLNLTKDKYIPNEFHDKLKRSQLQEDDLLINLVGASIGRCAKIDENALPANINQAVALIRINKSKILPDFLLYQLMNDKIQNQLASSKVEGARANISLKNIKELQIILPNIEIQKKFVGIINKLKHDSLLLQEGLNNLYNLYNSILGKAFNGDIFTEEKVSNF